MSHYVYILRCADATYYTGYTNDLNRRIKAHQEKKGAKYTRGRTPVELLFYQTFKTKSEAMKVEYEVKQLSRKQKEQFMKERGFDLDANSKKL